MPPPIILQPTRPARRRRPVAARAAVLLAPFLLASVLMPPTVPAQAPGAKPTTVRYTEARDHTIRQHVQLPGSVQPATSSLVASEVAGLVMEFPAREGTLVKRGQPLARLRETALDLRVRAARAEVEEAKARRALAERELERARSLFEEQVFSQQQLDASHSDLEVRQAQIARLEAEIARLADDIERSTIRAPFDGIIVTEHTSVGEWVAVGGAVAELQAVTPLDVVVDVPERYFSAIRRGTHASVGFDALPGLELDARISAIVPRANPQARTFPVKIRIANPGGRIGAGMMAQVSFPIGEPARATIVPKDAVILDGAQRFVFVINGQQTVERVSIRSGAEAGDWVAVEGAVTAGMPVVTRGNERLRPGQAVAGQPLEYPLP